MLYRVLPWMLLALAATSTMACAQSAAEHARGNAMPADAAANVKQLIVTYKDGPDSASANAANAKIGAIFVRPLDRDHALVSLPANADLDQAMAQLRQQPGVTAVEIHAKKTVDPRHGPTLNEGANPR